MLYFPRVLLLLLVASVWTTTHGADPTFPEMKEIFNYFYQSEAELTDQNQQASAFSFETYDGTQTRGRMTVVVLGERKTIFYYNTTNEILEVNSTSCLASAEEQSLYYDLEVFYGWLNKDPLIIGPSALLWYANRKDGKKPEYVGTKYVRGIKCDQFKLKVDDNRNRIVYDYYFAVKEWTTPFKTELRVPVRVEINGESSRDSRKIVDFAPINQTVDFIYFSPSIRNWLSFQPPVGLGCYGRKTDFELPKIPDEFRFFSESYDILHAEKAEDVDINSYRIWFDSNAQLARLDSYTKEISLSEIYDFNTGVTYSKIDDRMCKIRSLRGAFFELDEKMVGYIKTPKQVLGLDGDFYYMGERSMRGIRCRVFESVLRNSAVKEMGFYQMVLTVYFTNEDMEIVVEGEELRSAPIYYLLTGYDVRNHVSLKHQYNIYGFDDVVGSSIYEDFNIGECFPFSQQKSYFVILIPVETKTATEIEGKDDIFIKLLRSEITKVASVSGIRIPFLQADYQTSGIYVTGLILDRPPAMTQFWLEDTAESKSSDLLRIIPEAATREQCAYACVNQSAFTCKAFHFCSNVCFLNEEDITEGFIDTATLGVCEIYVRAESNSNNNEVYLATALEKLAVAIQNGTFKVDVPIIVDGPKTKTIEIIPNEIIIGEGPLMNKNDPDTPYKLVFNGFQLPGEKDAETTVENTFVTTENDCYRSCKKDKSISCASFSYCADASNKMCRISSVLMVGGKDNFNDVTPNTLCNVYSMMYMDYYEPYPGRTVLIPGEATFKLKSVEECAQKCRATETFVCRGFEYCRSQKSCVLHSKHVLDLKSGESGSTSSGLCTHYAAKYSADYQDLGYTLVDDDSNVRNEISLEECARVCSEEMPTCKSFNYCPASDPYATDSTCAVTVKTLVSPGVKTTVKGKCHHYSKRDAVEDWGIAPPKVNTSGYTEKGFVGLVIGMLIFGMIVGVIAFVGYSYYRTRHGGDGLSVKFMKQADS